MFITVSAHSANWLGLGLYKKRQKSINNKKMLLHPLALRTVFNLRNLNRSTASVKLLLNELSNVKAAIMKNSSLSYHNHIMVLLTIREVATGINFPDNLSLLRTADASALIVQKVFR